MKKNNVTYEPSETQSRASLLKLVETYPKPWEIWLDFRMKLLTQWEKERGSLTCAYCGQPNLQKETQGVRPKLQATLDHVVPRAKGGAEYDVNNLVVACRPCNARKGCK